DKAKIILSLDCDFLGTEDDAHNHIRRFVNGRNPDVTGGMSRLYAVESLFTLTGANADHRMRVPASTISKVAHEIFTQISGSAPFLDRWIRECARDLHTNRGQVLVIAGQRQPMEVHLLAHAINSALDAIGNTITLLPTTETPGADLKNLDGSATDTLVILGGNPVYHLNWSPAQKPKTVVRLGYHEDETTEKADWNFPAAHYLESWGDATISDGTFVPVQPLIQPLFGGLTELEFLAHIAGDSQTNPYDIVRATFAGSEEAWKKFLFNGYLADSAGKPVDGKFSAKIPAIKSSELSVSNLEVVFHRDAKMDDGRYANNGWMQELPDPVTKMSWDNAVLVSRKTASELGVQNGDIVEITLNGRSVEGPIWTQPGMADYSLGLALGYGREGALRVGTGIGFNAYKIFSGKYVETGAIVRKTGETHVIATTQNHWSMEGRPVVREANLEEFSKDPAFAKEMHAKEPPVVGPLYPNPLDKAKKTALHQWGLTVDLTACVGCGTCVVACQSENNIPIVGKDQVHRGREMHWMRIDRYYTAPPATKSLADEYQKDSAQQFEAWIDDVQAVNQPVMCQMCEAAPCENVCPVSATSHNHEGLNTMTYNRCIGTRYCSNNCPYK